MFVDQLATGVAGADGEDQDDDGQWHRHAPSHPSGSLVEQARACEQQRQCCDAKEPLAVLLVDPLADIAPDLPEAVTKVVQHALSLDPAGRPTAAEFSSKFAQAAG